MNRAGAAPPRHLHLSDLAGLARLASEGVTGVTDLVEAMHLTVLRAPGPLAAPATGRTRGITGLAYRSVRGVNALVAGVLDKALGTLAARAGTAPSTRQREHLVSVLNGVLGDHLEASGNPLALSMGFRRDGMTLPLARPELASAVPAASARLLVLVHGLCLNDLHWLPSSTVLSAGTNADTVGSATAGLGARLQYELGYTPVYLHYNSGRKIAANGREFAERLERLVARWPVPVTELAIVGHSMGGLVSRSACQFAALQGHAWLPRLRHLAFLGTPHHGAPLERGGHWIDRLLAGSAYTAPFARLGGMRSAGITDLRHGRCVEDVVKTRRASSRRNLGTVRKGLPPGARCYAIAATTGTRTGDLNDRLLGDGLVPVASALGTHPDPDRDLGIPASRRHIACATGHLALLHDEKVLGRVAAWFAESVD